MKLSKEEITAIGLAVVQDVFKEEVNFESISLKQADVNLYALASKGYYTHEGWVFKIDSKKLYGNEAKTFLIYLLDNGIPLHMASLLGDDNPRTIYAVLGADGHYKPISKDNFYTHHNFDFANGFNLEMY